MLRTVSVNVHATNERGRTDDGHTLPEVFNIIACYSTLNHRINQFENFFPHVD